jgi:hypothetical protein
MSLLTKKNMRFCHARWQGTNRNVGKDKALRERRNLCVDTNVLWESRAKRVSLAGKPSCVLAIITAERDGYLLRARDARIDYNLTHQAIVGA